MMKAIKYTMGVEFGNDKICVVHAVVQEDGVTDILSFVAKPSRATVYKGAIVDVNGACGIMRDAIDESEKILKARHCTIDRGNQQIFCLFNGPEMISQQGSASIQITSPSKKITSRDLQLVTNQAAGTMCYPNMQRIASIDGCFYIDDNVRESNVIGKIAGKLTAQPHFVFAPAHQLETVRKIFDELGFERPVIPFYSPVAATFSTLTKDEREHGALLFDYGYGVSSYVFVYQDGVLLSGCIPVGVSNIVNDLHVGLELPFDFCQTFLKEGRLSKLRAQGQNFVEYQESSSKVRKVPLDSFEKIIELRMRETFNLMHDKLASVELLNIAPNASLVLIGGGALIDSACEDMADIFQLPIRRGSLLNLSGFDVAQIRPPCCCAAIVGLMKNVSEFGYEPVSGNPLIEVLSGIGGRAAKICKLLLKA